MSDVDEKFDGHCRFCNSDDDLDYDTIEMDGEVQFQDVKCNICKKKFTIYSQTEWYLAELEEGLGDG